MHRFDLTVIGNLTDALVADYKRRGYTLHFEGWRYGQPVHIARHAGRRQA